MKNIITALLLFMTCIHVLGQSPITDPVANFRSRYDMTGVTQIYKLQADINNDGRSDILMAAVEPDMESQYPAWYIYIAQADGTYVLAGEKTNSGVDPHSLPTINVKAYKIGQISEINKYGLLTLSCGTGGQAKCQLEAIVIENNAWKEISIGNPVSAETKYDELMKRFPKPLTPALQTLAP